MVTDSGLRCDIVTRLVKSQLGGVVHGTLQQPHGDLWSIGQLGSQRQSRVHELIVVDHLSDQAQIQCLIG
jgi:hypothetical protein